MEGMGRRERISGRWRWTFNGRLSEWGRERRLRMSMRIEFTAFGIQRSSFVVFIFVMSCCRNIIFLRSNGAIWCALFVRKDEFTS